jgi:dolichyl-phosphate beta-glucosyltransferase
MHKIAIIIPCYNEEKRLKSEDLQELIRSTDADVFLANDGSRDGTLSVLQAFAQNHPDRCDVLDFQPNSGKANTIFLAVNELLKRDKYDYIGYFDADFSTPVSQITKILDEAKSPDVSFSIGSRVQLLNSGIKRKAHRHIIGRIIITLINLKFKLGIYDTQCGAKLFSTDILKQVFDKPFVTSWLFDVEIFVRLQKKGLLTQGREVPIRDWVDVEGSKLGWRTGFKILMEMYRLFKTY